jgi:hypothetical protein
MYPLDAVAMQNVSGYGVTALLDGTRMARIPPGEFQMDLLMATPMSARFIGCASAKVLKWANARSLRRNGRL